MLFDDGFGDGEFESGPQMSAFPLLPKRIEDLRYVCELNSFPGVPHGKSHLAIGPVTAHRDAPAWRVHNRQQRRRLKS
jgi:hypothetical protein